MAHYVKHALRQRTLRCQPSASLCHRVCRAAFCLRCRQSHPAIPNLCHWPQKACRGMQPALPAGLQDLWGPAAVVPEAEQLAGLGHLSGHLLCQRRPLPAGSGSDSGRRVCLWVSSEPIWHAVRACELQFESSASPPPQGQHAAGIAVGLIRDLPRLLHPAVRPSDLVGCLCTRTHAALCCLPVFRTEQCNTLKCQQSMLLLPGSPRAFWRCGWGVGSGSRLPSCWPGEQPLASLLAAVTPRGATHRTAG